VDISEFLFENLSASSSTGNAPAESGGKVSIQLGQLKLGGPRSVANGSVPGAWANGTTPGQAAGLEQRHLVILLDRAKKIKPFAIQRGPQAQRRLQELGRIYEVVREVSQSGWGDIPLMFSVPLSVMTNSRAGRIPPVKASDPHPWRSVMPERRPGSVHGVSVRR
jgi:hypothetical protein